MKRFFISAIGALTAVLAFGAPTGSLLKVERLNVSRNDTALVIDMVINPDDIHPGRDREVVFTPVIRSVNGSDSLELDPMTIAGRNRYLLADRHGFIDAGEPIYMAGKGAPIEYRRSVPYKSWMMRSTLDMREDVANCCDPLDRLADTPLALLDYTPRVYEPECRYVALTGDSAVELEAEGRAYVDFIVNRTEIRPTYRRNTIEIAKIIGSIDRVKNDPDATITRITVKGYASPEGSYSNNVRLAMGRTNSLKEYVRSHYDFSPEIMHSDYEPEDWAGLRAWVEECTLPHRAEILEIIDSSMEPDPKDHEIRRRYPQEYALMLDSIYPALRHSDYTVKYRIRTFVDIDELKHVFDTAPERLRPVDFYRIASTYTPGSEEYDNTLMKAVEVWPNDPEANVNAANIALKRGDVAAATAYARRSGESPEAMYTRANLAARQGDRARAAELLEASSALEYAPAQTELHRLHEVEAAPTVQYFIDCAH